jgi:hypothetical protein
MGSRKSRGCRGSGSGSCWELDVFLGIAFEGAAEGAEAAREAVAGSVGI